ncbi:PREDICTED: A-kinase anchor protein 4, partial [Bison bison bison]|uniref:A-kinase anchor protein 4 n=1 Tax=Bison bison bison TaxID=43346 RepID=A0A6P3IDC4_BISBB
TEGSVCLFKQAPSDPLSVFNWLLNDLQKYALGFQHALSPSASSCKHKVGETEGNCQKLSSGNCYSIYANHLNMDCVNNEPQSLRLEMTAAKNTNNNQSPSTPPGKSPSNQRAVISICFVDVSTLSMEDKDSKDAAGCSSEGDLNLENLEEKEIIVIKDTEKQDQSKWNQKQCNQGKMPSKTCPHKEEKREKISPSTDSLAKDLIVSALMLIQYHLTQQAKGKEACEDDCPPGTTSYMTQSAQYEKCGGSQSAKALSMKHLETRGAPGPSTSMKDNQHLDSQKLDMSNMVLSLIQKLLNESPFNCEDLCEGENKHSEIRTNKSTSIFKKSDREEEQGQDNREVDFVSGMKQVNRQFIDQLVESVMKLCLIMAKYSNNEAALTDLEEQASSSNNSNFYQTSGPRSSYEAGMSQSYQDSHGPEVIVNNQCSTSSLQKQLQAVLQWIAASQFNVPMLYFMGDDDGQLEKLPEVSAKAAEKGYSVGDLLQEVMKFAKERQLDEAVGNMARKQLLDWLLANL